MRWALIILPLSAIGMYRLGAWLMSLYGLDPPYIYFNAGLTLQLAAFCAAIAALVLLLFMIIRRGYRAISKSGNGP